MARECPLEQENPVSPINQSAPAPVSKANGKRDRAPELMRGKPAWRLNALLKPEPSLPHQPVRTGARERSERQARPRARAYARRPAWRLNAI